MRRLLLDTHALLWWLVDNASLGPLTRNLIADPNNLVYVSAASVWEISIKQRWASCRCQRTFLTSLRLRIFCRCR
ncbi:Uncharacterised protein [Serratia plymuthica]|nr:Uncharacterised protein [Serratia plymuthica]